VFANTPALPKISLNTISCDLIQSNRFVHSADIELLYLRAPIRKLYKVSSAGSSGT
jgi:hypothetical protein